MVRPGDVLLSVKEYACKCMCRPHVQWYTLRRQIYCTCTVTSDFFRWVDAVHVPPSMYVSLSLSPSLPLSSPLSSNVLSLRARSLHSLPDSWQPGTFPYTFSLAMPIAQPPSISSKSTETLTSSQGIVVPQGALKLCPDKDHGAVSAHWRWPHLPGVTTNASLVGGCPMEPCPLEEEVGQLNTKQVNIVNILG